LYISDLHIRKLRLRIPHNVVGRSPIAYRKAMTWWSIGVDAKVAGRLPNRQLASFHISKSKEENK